MSYEEPKRLTEVEYQNFKKFVMKLDKEKGNTYALGVIRGAIFFKHLNTEQQIKLITAVYLS